MEYNVFHLHHILGEINKKNSEEEKLPNQILALFQFYFYERYDLIGCYGQLLHFVFTQALIKLPTLTIIL